MTFVHLHVHSEYSFLDGACRLKNLVSRARELRMPALALTDHGGLHGAVEFYQLARENGIKPIIGCEVYLTPGSRLEKAKEQRKNYHLILLAKNRKGYENLVQLVSRSHLEGFYYKPRIDWELLSAYAEGLVALSGCLSGEIPQLLLQDNYCQAELKALEYRELFGPDFYIELQNHGLKEENRSNLLLRKLAQKTGIPLVATNDVHYTDSRESTVQELMAAIRRLQKNNDPIPFPQKELYLKSSSEMKDLFGEIPEAMENTLKISEKCNLELGLGSVRLPDFPLDQGISHDDFLFHLCREGLATLYHPLTVQIEERLEKELETIRKMRLAPYFLVVADLMAFARRKGIPAGPGRGSAAGSLVTYSLGITHVDPIKHNLFFERFLNPQRPDLPDIDLDFCQQRRNEVLSYLTEKYGAGNVAQIGIFSTLGARGAIRDAGKALGIPEQAIDLVAKNLPRFSGLGGIEHALSTLPEFKELPLQEEPFRTLIEKAKSIEGRIRHTSVHAAGVVIGQGNLSKIVPLQFASGGETVTQYGPESLEALGLIKIDLLGLRNLTIIDSTLKFLINTRVIKLTPESIPLDDPATTLLLQKGETLGCFQLESSGIRSLLKKLKPNSLEDLIAVLALYRPGPWDSGMVERIGEGDIT
ncbi:MAG: DNA polymerase III subunit alpha [Peptococcaceae bacterium]|nr:DNA polymerase III subunit alpha [Peptococcaceae bacterium]